MLRTVDTHESEIRGLAQDPCRSEKFRYTIEGRPRNHWESNRLSTNSNFDFGISGLEEVQRSGKGHRYSQQIDGAGRG